MALTTCFRSGTLVKLHITQEAYTVAIRVVQVTLDNRNAPISGSALYLVIAESLKQVTLLYPWNLSLFHIKTEEFEKGEGAVYWPLELRTAPANETFDINKLVTKMEHLLEDYTVRVPPKQHPAQEVRRVIAEIKGIPIEDVPQFREAKAPKVGAPAVGTTRRPGVIDAIKDALEGGFTIDELVKSLQVKFPEREADGMRNTVKCQIARLPKNTNRQISKTEVAKRGIVFQWVK